MDARTAAEAHNSSLPVNKIPPELLGDIFLTERKSVYESTSDGLERSRAATSSMPELTAVCHYWRAVAVDTAALWAYVDADPEQHDEILPTRLQRSKQAPLDITCFLICESKTQSIMAFVQPHIWRARFLKIFVYDGAAASQFFPLPQSMPHLSYLFLSLRKADINTFTAPRPVHVARPGSDWLLGELAYDSRGNTSSYLLSIENVPGQHLHSIDSRDYASPSVITELYKLAGRAPCLTAFRLYGGIGGLSTVNVSPIKLSNLRILDTGNNSLLIALRYMHAPQLRHLRLGSPDSFFSGFQENPVDFRIPNQTQNSLISLHIRDISSSFQILSLQQLVALDCKLPDFRALSHMALDGLSHLRWIRVRSAGFLSSISPLASRITTHDVQIVVSILKSLPNVHLQFPVWRESFAPFTEDLEPFAARIWDLAVEGASDSIPNVVDIDVIADAIFNKDVMWLKKHGLESVLA